MQKKQSIPIERNMSLKMKICEACGKGIEEHSFTRKVLITRPHEIVSRGAGGKCIEDNQLILCKPCHEFWHIKGWDAFLTENWHLEEKVLAAMNREKQEQSCEIMDGNLFI